MLKTLPASHQLQSQQIPPRCKGCAFDFLAMQLAGGEPGKECIDTNFLQGDLRDAALMAFSLVLFCCIGAQMYGIYLHLYTAAGLKPILRHW
jgi:hypothetical protein